MGDSLDLQTRVAADLTARAGTFSITGWTATTPLAPDYVLEDGHLDNIVVAVCPASRTKERTNRQLRSKELGIWVGVLKRLTLGQDATADLAETRALINFCEELSDVFLPDDGSHYMLNNQYRAMELTNDPLYDPDKLRTVRQFMSVQLVTFRLDQ